MKKQNPALVFLICYIAYVGIYIARLNLSMASPALTEMGVINTAQIGILGSMFSVIYACGRLLNGFLGDSRSPVFMICTGLILCGSANLLVGFLPPFVAMVLLWAANAYAQSMLWSSILCVVTRIYDARVAKKRTSLMVTSVATGNILGIVLNTVIISRFGVRFAFIIPGAFALFMSLPVYLFTRSISQESASYGNHTPFTELLSDSGVRKTVLPAVLHGVIKDNVSLWMTVYFVDTFKIDLNQSSYFVLFIPVVGFAGRMMYPFFFKLCKEKQERVSLIFFLVCAACCLPLFIGKPHPIVSAVCLGLIYAAVSVINTSILSIFPLDYAASGNVASVSGIMDFSTYLGAGIGSITFGFVIDNFGYSPMYVIWAAISVVSFVFMLLTRKKKAA
ncbi:MAG: MFS transporter [Oscillospiraceae bacterium]|nr:MFS transporter [Oscillospiraceae bacterium]